MHKKGLSAVVTTALLISMVVVLLSVVWVVVQGFVTRSGEEISIGKVELTLDISKVYVDAGNLVVNVERGKGSGELKGINFILESDDKSEIIKQDASLREFDTDKFILSPTEINVLDIKKVSVAPVLSSGTADITDVWEPGVKGIECATRIDCAGKQCGSDGCGGTCGSGCMNTQDCSATGLCLNKLRIFVTRGTTNGNIKGTLYASGVAGADDKCMTDLSNPNPSGIWKALIGSSSPLRQVETDWVLQANRNYYQVNGVTLIDTTDANGWFTFTPNLDNAINSSATSVWTGLTSTGIPSFNTCNFWAYGGSVGTGGTRGLPPSLTTSSISNTGALACSTNIRLYCVEQP